MTSIKSIVMSKLHHHHHHKQKRRYANGIRIVLLIVAVLVSLTIENARNVFLHQLSLFHIESAVLDRIAESNKPVKESKIGVSASVYSIELLRWHIGLVRAQSFLRFDNYTEVVEKVHEQYERIGTITAQEAGMDPIFDEYNLNERQAQKWADVTLADINIIGAPKTGTSHLYNILTSHPNATAFDKKNKEFCMSRPYTKNAGNVTAAMREAQERFFVWHENLYQQRLNASSNITEEEAKLITVNGCIAADPEIQRWFFLHQPANKRYIYLLRDPADFSWSAWNFWQREQIDTVITSQSRWTDPSVNYRSPELFHELIVAGDKNPSFSPIHFFLNEMVAKAKQIKEAFPPGQVLFLRNEDLLPGAVATPGGLLDKLSKFTGLDRSQFSEQVYSKKTNCNDSKGAGSQCEDNSSKALASRALRPGAPYAIAGGRGMLSETRHLIYVRFWHHCKILSDVFDVHYPDCLNVAEEWFDKV